MYKRKIKNMKKWLTKLATHVNIKYVADKISNTRTLTIKQ